MQQEKEIMETQQSKKERDDSVDKKKAIVSGVVPDNELKGSDADSAYNEDGDFDGPSDSNEGDKK